MPELLPDEPEPPDPELPEAGLPLKIVPENEIYRAHASAGQSQFHKPRLENFTEDDNNLHDYDETYRLRFHSLHIKPEENPNEVYASLK